MKLSEIFKRASSREEPSSESQTVASKEEKSAELPPFKTVSERLPAQADAELIPFEPPRAPLPEGYYYPDDKESAHIHAELLRELPADHPLFGVPLETFAAFEDNQDVLFRYRGNPRRFVLVHLTWIGRTEISKNYPSVTLNGTFSEFFDYRLAEILEFEQLIHNREAPAE